MFLIHRQVECVSAQAVVNDDESEEAAVRNFVRGRDLDRDSARSSRAVHTAWLALRVGICIGEKIFQDFAFRLLDPAVVEMLEPYVRCLASEVVSNSDLK